MQHSGLGCRLGLCSPPSEYLGPALLQLPAEVPVGQQRMAPVLGLLPLTGRHGWSSGEPPFFMAPLIRLILPFNAGSPGPGLAAVARGEWVSRYGSPAACQANDPTTHTH